MKILLDTPPSPAVHGATPTDVRLVPAGRSRYQPRSRQSFVSIGGARHVAVSRRVAATSTVVALAGSSVTAATLMLGLAR